MAEASAWLPGVEVFESAEPLPVPFFMRREDSQEGAIANIPHDPAGLRPSPLALPTGPRMDCMYWSVKEAAAYFGVSEDTIRRMIAAEELEHVRLRGAIRIPKGARPRPIVAA